MTDKTSSSRNAQSFPAGASDCDARVKLFDSISQQIRRPVDGMRAVTDLLRRQPLSPDALAYVRTLDDHYQALLRTLADAGDMVRAESGQLELEPGPVELRMLMDDVQAEWAPRVEESNVALSISYDGSDIAAQADAPRLKQIFNHLITRALAVTRRCGVEAQLHARREGVNIIIEGRVRDSGAVLPSTRLAGLFDGTNENIEGANLVLCKHLIAAMGGEIHAASNAGSGVTIQFAFMTQAAQTEDADDGCGRTTARAAHVLVVDDNATNRMVAEALCEMFDCTSESAEDGVEAVEAASSGRFDLILMDIKMPRMDGIEATKAIRAMGGRKGGVPIIALTANADPDDAANYLASGMSSVVEKPIKPEALLAAINACLPGAGEDDAHAAAA